MAFLAQAAVVLGLPFVRVGGESALRFDVPSLTLHAFGARVLIDELFLVLAATLAATFAFAFVTVAWGRVWCGWACPQTVFVEGIFRPLERLVNGPRNTALERAKEQVRVLDGELLRPLAEMTARGGERG